MNKNITFTYNGKTRIVELVQDRGSYLLCIENGQHKSFTKSKIQGPVWGVN